MPENKRQHYVPQNYLKGFSLDGEFVQWTFKHIQEPRKPLIDETEIPQGENRSLVISRQTFPYLYMALTFMKFQDKVKPY